MASYFCFHTNSEPAARRQSDAPHCQAYSLTVRKEKCAKVKSINTKYKCEKNYHMQKENKQNKPRQMENVPDHED